MSLRRPLLRTAAVTAVTAAVLAAAVAGTATAGPGLLGGPASAHATTAPPIPPTASASPMSPAPRGRGALVRAERLRSLSAAQARDLLGAAGFDSSRAASGVTLHRLTYRTVDVRGRATIASALLGLPRARPGTAAALDVVLHAHGSAVHRGDAPSVSTEPWTLAGPVSHAAAGFAVVAPDYLGLGTGPGSHPWMHKPSEVTASLDALRAARAFARGRELRPGVLLTGFSQGASAATALAKALQRGADPYFRARAVAAISGGYDFRGAQLPALLRGELDDFWSTAYTAYLLIAWNRIHQLHDDPAEVFRTPYDETLPPLFDGEHPGSEVGAALPPSIDELLTAEGRASLAHPTGALARALRVADATCTGWRSPIPVRLYLADGGDEQVAAANSTSCLRSLRAGGVPAALVTVGDVDHLTSNVRATAAAVAWFSALTSRS